MTNVVYQPTEEKILDLSPNNIELVTYDEIIKVNEISDTIIVNPSIQGGTIVSGSGDQVFRADPTYGIWLGNAVFDSAPFSVTMEGILTASSIIVVGGTIRYGKTSFTDDTNAGYYIGNEGMYFGSASNANYIKYDISGATFTIYGTTIDAPILTSLQSGSEISIQGWQHDMTFSSTDADIVAWTSGTITLLDGTTYSIDAGTTGNMTGTTYIFLDIIDSITVLQLSTDTVTDPPTGSGRILIAVAQDVTA